MRALTSPQRILRRLLSDLSEGCTCCSWATDWEFRAWASISLGPDHAVAERLERDEVEDLQFLSDIVGGWLTYDAAHRGFLFVPMQEWLQAFENWLAVEGRRSRVPLVPALVRDIRHCETPLDLSEWASPEDGEAFESLGKPSDETGH